jgi:hypothetical protein
MFRIVITPLVRCSELMTPLACPYLIARYSSKTQPTAIPSGVDSETQFFQDWEWWKKVLDCPNVSFRFRWVLENTEGTLAREDVKAGDRPLHSVAKVRPPPSIGNHCWNEFWSIPAGIAGRYHASGLCPAPARGRCRPPGGAPGVRRVPQCRLPGTVGTTEYRAM